MPLADKSPTCPTFLTLPRARICPRPSPEPKHRHHPRNNNRSRRGGRIRPPRAAKRAPPSQPLEEASFRDRPRTNASAATCSSCSLSQFFTIPRRFLESSTAKIEVTYFFVCGIQRWHHHRLIGERLLACPFATMLDSRRRPMLLPRLISLVRMVRLPLLYVTSAIFLFVTCPTSLLAQAAPPASSAQSGAPPAAPQPAPLQAVHLKDYSNPRSAFPNVLQP